MSIFTLTNLARNRTLSVKNNLHVFCKHLNLQYFLIIKYSRRMYDKSFVCSLAVKVITIQAVCWYTFYCLFTFTRHIYNLVSLASSGSTSSSSKLTRLETVTSSPSVFWKVQQNSLWFLSFVRFRKLTQWKQCILKLLPGWYKRPFN